MPMMLSYSSLSVVQFRWKKNFNMCISVVTVAGICNSVGGGVFLTCHRGGSAGGKYWLVSRLGLLIGNRWMSQFGYPGMR